jgi:hypothetical protein
MDWNELPILAVLIVGFAGFCVMLAALLMVALQGAQAMQPGGRWSLPWSLLFAGACLGVVFSLALGVLFLIPGGIPWADGSDGGVALITTLTTFAAVWYFVLRPTLASSRQRRPQP